MRKALFFALLTALCIAGCGGSGGGSSSNNTNGGATGGANGSRLVNVSVVVTDTIGNIVTSYTDSNVAVDQTNENQVIADHLAALVTAHAAQMPTDATMIISDYADLNVGNYLDLQHHPEYIRYPRLSGDPPLDSPVTLFSGGTLQQLFIFDDSFDLSPGIKRIMDYLQNEVQIPTDNGSRTGMGRAQAVTLFVRPTTSP